MLCADNGCKKGTFVIAIDAGHSRNVSGAISARGVPEYTFNKNLAKLLLSECKKNGLKKAFIINGNGDDMPLPARTATAHAKKAHLLISIHHDSVQPQYLRPWVYEKKTHWYSDQYRGFSLFYSRKNSMGERSLLFAKFLGAAMVKEGLQPSFHHAEPIDGEGRELVDSANGIYRFDDLLLLQEASMPAVLLESGIIVNREEETRLMSPDLQDKIVSAIIHALDAYCTVHYAP